MSNPNSFPDPRIADKLQEMQGVLDRLRDLYDPGPVHIYGCLDGVLDVLEEMYLHGEPAEFPTVSEETKRHRHLEGDLSDLIERKDETRRAIKEGTTGGGEHYYLKGLYKLIRDVKDELEPLARPPLFPLTGTEDNT